jgi:voltage-gated potassium channel
MYKLRPSQINSLKYAAGLTLVSVMVGVTGFMLIEHFNVPDAFYMSVITVAGVGAVG